MTFYSLAEKVAEEFKSMMQDEGFETFSEMVRCYQWDTEDIKDEVDFILKDIGEDCYIDEEDRNYVYLHGCESIPYSKFSRMFRKHLKDMIESED